MQYRIAVNFGTQADGVQICGKFRDTQYMKNGQDLDIH